MIKVTIRLLTVMPLRSVFRLFEVQDDQDLPEIGKIGNGDDRPGFCQFIGVFLYVADVADEDARKEFGTDIGGDDSVSLRRFILRIAKLEELEPAVAFFEKGPADHEGV